MAGEKYPCSACDGEYTVNVRGLIRQHKSKINPEYSCPGSGNLPKDHGPRPADGAAEKLISTQVGIEDGYTEILHALTRMNAKMELAAGRHVSVCGELVQVWKDVAVSPGTVTLVKPRNKLVAYFNPPPIEAVIPPVGAECTCRSDVMKEDVVLTESDFRELRCPIHGFGALAVTGTRDEAVLDAIIATKGQRMIEDVRLSDGSPIGPPGVEEPSWPFDQPAERDFEWEGRGQRQNELTGEPTFEQPTAQTDSEVALLFEQPDAPKRAAKRERQPLSPRAYARAERFRDDFWRYEASRPRSTQLSIGPSEVGATCDRRLGYSMTHHPVVNHRNDGWAAWVGTQGHNGLEDMYEWLDNGTGRWLVNQEVTFPVSFMPRGHVDQFDRKFGRVEDNKFPGESTLREMWLSGAPSRQYQVQLHVYGYGLKLLGEDVREVALLGLPRESGNLNDMFTWVEDYDEQIALDAIAHAGEIAQYVAGHGAHELTAKPSFLCRFCPFYLAGSPDPRWGCPSR